MMLNLGLRRPKSWQPVVTSIQLALIVAGLFPQHALLIAIQNEKAVDS